MFGDNFLKNTPKENFIDKTIAHLNKKFEEMGYKLVDAHLTTDSEELTPQQVHRFEVIDFADRIFTEPNDDGTFTHTFMPLTEDYETLSQTAFEE